MEQKKISYLFNPTSKSCILRHVVTFSLEKKLWSQNFHLIIQFLKFPTKIILLNMFNSIKKMHDIDMVTRQIHQLSLHQIDLNILANNANEYDITQHEVPDLNIAINMIPTDQHVVHDLNTLMNQSLFDLNTEPTEEDDTPFEGEPQAIHEESNLNNGMIASFFQFFGILFSFNIVVHKNHVI